MSHCCPTTTQWKDQWLKYCTFLSFGRKCFYCKKYKIFWSTENTVFSFKIWFDRLTQHCHPLYHCDVPTHFAPKSPSTTTQLFQNTKIANVPLFFFVVFLSFISRLDFWLVVNWMCYYRDIRNCFCRKRKILFPC